MLSHSGVFSSLQQGCLGQTVCRAEMYSCTDCSSDTSASNWEERGAGAQRWHSSISSGCCCDHQVLAGDRAGLQTSQLWFNVKLSLWFREGKRDVVGFHSLHLHGSEAFHNNQSAAAAGSSTV